MIKIGEINKLPVSAGRYKILKLILSLILISLPLIILMGSKSWFTFLWSVGLILVLPISIWILLDTKTNTFLIDNNKLEVNWGILFKKTRTIMLKAVQNIKIEKGLLASMCGVWVINIWTASPSQVRRTDKEDINRPDGVLILTKEDARWLEEFISTSK